MGPLCGTHLSNPHMVIGITHMGPMRSPVAHLIWVAHMGPIHICMFAGFEAGGVPIRISVFSITDTRTPVSLITAGYRRLPQDTAGSLKCYNFYHFNLYKAQYI